MMGLFPPGSLTDKQKLSVKQSNGLSFGERGLPPIKIRDAQQVNFDLGIDPLPNGFVSIPVFSHKEATIYDDINMAGCSYINAVDGYNFPADSTYTSVDYLLEDLREPITEAFNLTSQ